MPAFFYLLLFLWVPSILVIGTMVFMVSRQGEHQAEERLQEDLEIIGRSIEGSLRHAMLRGDLLSASEALNSIFSFSRLYGAYLFNADGQLLLQTGEPRSYRQRDDLSELARSPEAYGDYDEIEGTWTYSFFVPLQDDFGRPVGLLQISRRQEDIDSAIADFRLQMILLVALGIVLLCLIMILGYQAAFGRRIQHLRQTMRKVSEGLSGQRVQPAGPREIAELGESFNEMLDSIERVQQKVRDKQEMEDMLRQRLVRSQRLASMGQMASILTHELGGPLSAIDAHAQLGLRKVEDAEPARSFQGVRDEVRRMATFIQQVVDFGKGQKGESSEYRPSDLLESAVRRARAAVGETETPVRVEGSAGASVLGYAFRVELAVKNLIQNGLQWARSEVHVEFESSEDGILYRISDDGPGVAPELRDVLFEPFTTTNQSAQSSGLGLSLVRQVADEHDGWVRYRWNESEQRGGFELFLPALRKPENPT
ncbi:MAG: sensor histidine kinase [Opitutales bacterium]|nr:sensor histidine kinase [Opitutales bacterium]